MLPHLWGFHLEFTYEQKHTRWQKHNSHVTGFHWFPDFAWRNVSHTSHLSHGSILHFSADLHLPVSLFVFLPEWGNILQYWVVKNTKIFRFTRFYWSYFYFCAVIYCNDWFISAGFGKMCTNTKHREVSIHRCMGIWHRSRVRQTIWISDRKQSFSLI